MEQIVRERFDESAELIRRTQEHLADRLIRAAKMLIQACKGRRGVFLFGNGGSAADAQHFACELVGRFLRERPALRAEALTCDSSTLTSVANDYGFEAIFARQLEGKASPGDVAVGISTSGNSPSVVKALARAKELGLGTIALTGSGGGGCATNADVLLDVPSDCTPRVQEAHAVIYHVLCELTEGALVPDELE